MLYEKTLQDNICNIKNLDNSILNINVYFNKYYYDKINEDTNFNDHVLLSEYNLLPDEEVQLTLKEDGNYSLVLFDEINNITTTIDIRIYINYRLSMIKDYLVSFCLDNSKYNNNREPDSYPKNLQGILNDYISLESIINYAFLNNYFNNEFFTLYLENAYNHYRHLFIPDTLNQRQYLNCIGKYNTKYSLCNKTASIFIIGFYLTDIAINTDTKINKIYSINRIKKCINKFGLVYETLKDIYYIEASIPPEDLPTVITNNVSNITENSVTLNGEIIAGSEEILSQGFEWKLTSALTWSNIDVLGNTISHVLTELTSNNSYQVRTFATTASGTTYGQINSFTTLAMPTIVETNTATLIGQTQATLNGTITTESETVLSQGFEWKLASASNWTIVNKSLTGNSVSHNLTGLTANTAYEFRAFAINEDGTIYGAVQNFTTLLIPPTVTTNPATMITQDSSTINGTIIVGTNPILSQGFELKVLTGASWSIYNSTLVEDNISNNITGLVPNTTYQFRAYATTVEGKVYGTIQNFATLEIVPPTVTTSLPTEITSTSVILNGIITQGSEPIIYKGFYWKASFSSDWVRVYVNETPHTITLENLIPNTVYEFRAFANTATDVVYGELLNFTTLFNIYFGVADTIPTDKEEIITQESTTSLTFTTPEITKNINFIAFPETLTLVSVENNSFPGDFWYDDDNDLYVDKTIMDIDGVNYNIYCMTTFMPIAVGAKVILSK